MKLKLEELKNINYVKTNAIEDIENVILKTDFNQNLIIYATHVLYQFSNELKDEFYAMLDFIGSKRDYYFLSVEGIKLLKERYNSNEAIVELTHFKNKQTTRTLLAEVHGHGNWVKWK